MVRGLCSSWKQVIFVGFDTTMTKDLLYEVITRLHEIGYPVVFCTSDCGSGNVGLWKALGITTDEPWFVHPVTGDCIVYMPDVPHLLKLLRNWILDGGFILEDGSRVSKEPVEDLLNVRGNSEISSIFKLTEQHFTCKGTARQNVELAVQFISNSVGTALLRYKPENEEKARVAVSTGNFLKLMNSWFDLFNVYQPKLSAPSLSAYGLFKEEQDKILTEVRKTIQNMKVPGKNTLALFQKGIMMTTRALPLLLENLEAYNVRYILTHRLNQDVLENIFSVVRSKGGLNDKPSPLDSLYRLRLIILGKNPGVIQAHANTKVDQNFQEEFLSSRFLKKTEIDVDIPTGCISNDECTPVQNVEHIIQGRLKESDLEETDTAIHGTPKESGSEETDTATEKGSSTDHTTSTSTLSRVSESAKAPEMNKDGLEYLAGWMAYVYRKKYPHFSSERCSSVSTVPAHTAQVSWIQQLTYGGLTTPSENFLQFIKKVNGYVEKMVKPCGQLPKGKNVVRTLTKKIMRKLPSDAIEEVVFRFVRLRLVIKMRYSLKQGELFQKKRRMDAVLGDVKRKMKLATVVQATSSTSLPPSEPTTPTKAKRRKVTVTCSKLRQRAPRNKK